MPVPNTTTFTLQDVVNEIGGGITSLQAAFTNANPDGFDPLYEGDKNSLLNFRNYDHTPPATGTAVILASGFTEQVACDYDITNTYYYDAGQGNWFNNTTLYFNESLTNPVVSGGLFFSDSTTVAEYLGEGNGFAGASLCIGGIG